MKAPAQRGTGLFRGFRMNTTYYRTCLESVSCRSLVLGKGYPELIYCLEGNLAVFYNFLQISRGFATILITNLREAENDKQDTDH